ncbi:P1 family peptidase [Arthrobacter nitrophenolicus]|uniref:L-aminopeptidase/D-esterase-like protein n=2 Tax=Arthrobacter nitrophenolicus TaxID=683150 RepID=A0ACC6TA15_9MICC|nr:P1 family peptidase [Arthrobacter nitrophenolicus]ELT43610.1 L-aminopeptidase/D-esterase [Arthrobacter nitrophenolicus]
MGSLTDVPGVRVGQVHKIGAGWLTGVTVVLPPPGTVGSVDVQGGGPATHETDALDPTSLVSQVDAVVLTGGSAYGLASAAGVQRWCEENGRGFAVPGGVVPIVPAAAIFDLGRGGDFSARPTPEMGYAAAVAAAAEMEGHDVERGNVGAGTGALIGRTFKGGVGTASATLEGGVVVGALAVVNALGLPLVEHSVVEEAVVEPVETRGRDFGKLNHQGLNTTLVVVATNAVLDVAECKRTAAASHAGIARALNPSHTLADGDTVFCLATGGVALDRSDETARQISLVTLQSAAADVVRLAILDGVASAEPVSTPAGDYGAYGG